ncbi:MAG TPA: hypothetical protein VF515_01345 [Candidatus Binatia bacterium]
MKTVSQMAVTALVAVCGVYGLAAAQGNVAVPTSAPHTNSVEVRIGAVLASNTGKEFDQRLASMQRQFSTLFAYSSYRLVKEQHQQVAWGERVAFDIPGGRYVVVIPKEFKNDRVLMKVMLIEGTRPIVDTALSLRDHATFLVGGPREHDGVLILSIGADVLH